MVADMEVDMVAEMEGDMVRNEGGQGGRHGGRQKKWQSWRISRERKMIVSIYFMSLAPSH